MPKIDFAAAIKELVEKAKKENKQTEETIAKIRMLQELEDKYSDVPLTEDDIERAMSVTCFGLAYCCGLEKSCFWRDSALQVLGISPSKFREMKAKFTKDLINFVVGGPE